jgi:aminopeptidase N
MNLGFTLQEWKVEWLETAGLNEIQPIFNPSDLSNSAILQVKMTPALENHATLRRHKI